MDLKCLCCENEFEGTISKDELGWHSVCDDCGSSFDVDVPEGRIVVAFTNPDYDSAEPYKNFEQELPEENICSYYAFDTPKSFLEKWRELVNEPDGMWYWVLDDNVCICSGACDPGDIEIFEEHFGLEDLLSARITNLTLSPQAFKCLVYGGQRVDTIGKLFALSDEDLLGIEGLGTKRLAEIKDAFWTFWNSFEGFILPVNRIGFSFGKNEGVVNSVLLEHRIEFEEKYESADYGTTTLYFKAPKELFNGLRIGNFPDAVSMEISVEFPSNHIEAAYADVCVSPTNAEGSDYDWTDIDLPYEEINALIDLANKSTAKDCQTIDMLISDAGCRSEIAGNSKLGRDISFEKD